MTQYVFTCSWLCQTFHLHIVQWNIHFNELSQRLHQPCRLRVAYNCIVAVHSEFVCWWRGQIAKYRQTIPWGWRLQSVDRHTILWVHVQYRCLRKLARILDVWRKGRSYTSKPAVKTPVFRVVCVARRAYIIENASAWAFLSVWGLHFLYETSECSWNEEFNSVNYSTQAVNCV